MKNNVEFYLEIEKSLPNNFKDLTETFLSSHTFEADRFWGWIRWEKIPEDEAVFIDTTGKLERFYAVESLKLLKNLNDEEINKIDLKFENKEYNHDLALLAKKDSFIQFLDNLSENPKDWDFVLDQDEINCITNFKLLLNKAEQIWDDILKEDMRKGMISYDRVEEFKNEVLIQFNRLTQLRNLFNHLGLYENKTHKINEEKLRFGLNRIDDKAVFFENWHIQYPNWGNEYGRMMATGENASIFKEISNYCEEIIENLDETLESINKTDTIILYSGKKSTDFFQNSGKFIIKRGRNTPESEFDSLNEFRGYYQSHELNIPIFSVSGMDLNKILILQKSCLGKLIQYSPLDKDNDINLVKDIFYMNIQAFSDHEDLIKEYLEASIDWLKEIGNKKEQRKFLEEKVLIQIYERFEFKKDEKFEGYLLEL